MDFSHDLIVTTFNSYKYLDNLCSFIFDSLSKYSKILIIDDCSNNDFYQSLSSRMRKFKNIIIIKNEINLGPSASRNRGIKISRADYISFHDPDDIVFKKRFEIINYFINKYKPNVLFHGFSTKNFEKEIKNNYKYNIHFGILYLFKSLYVTPAFTCRRDLLEKVGGYNENIRYAEDIDLYIKLRKLSNFFFVNNVLVKISSKSERVNNPDHLSSNVLLMRKSINNIFLSQIYPLNFKSLFFLLALITNILKSSLERI